MKSDTTDTAVKDEDVGDIKQKQSDSTIFTAWKRGKDLREIASETGLGIDEVNRRLKPLEKAEVEHGAEHHGEENNT